MRQGDCYMVGSAKSAGPGLRPNHLVASPPPSPMTPMVKFEEESAKPSMRPTGLGAPADGVVRSSIEASRMGGLISHYDIGNELTEKYGGWISRRMPSGCVRLSARHRMMR